MWGGAGGRGQRRGPDEDADASPSPSTHTPVAGALEEQAHPRQRCRLHQRRDVELRVGRGVAGGQVQEQGLAHGGILAAPATGKAKAGREGGGIWWVEWGRGAPAEG